MKNCERQLPRFQFGLPDMLVSTAVVAVSVLLLRLSVQHHNPPLGVVVIATGMVSVVAILRSGWRWGVAYGFVACSMLMLIYPLMAFCWFFLTAPSV